MLEHLLRRLSADYEVEHFLVHFHPDREAAQIFRCVEKAIREFRVTLVPYLSDKDLIVSDQLVFDVDTFKMRNPEQGLFYKTYEGNFRIKVDHISNLISVDPFGRSYFKRDIHLSKISEKQSEFGYLSQSAHTSTFGQNAYFPFHHIYFDAEFRVLQIL